MSHRLHLVAVLLLLVCDGVFSLPMTGGKSSLNVAVAFGIAVYHLRFGLKVAY